MRNAISLIFPCALLLLLLLAAWLTRPQADDGAVDGEGESAAGDLAQATDQSEPEPEAEAAHARFIMVSHDWIEPLEVDQKKTRRETFGMASPSGVGACFDGNCRACLIDLVYGREF